MGILGYFTHFFGNQSMQWEKGTNLLLVDDLFFLNSFMKQPCPLTEKPLLLVELSARAAPTCSIAEQEDA